MSEKVCASRVSKKYPSVWYKPELVKKAVAELGLTLSEAKSLSKTELCKRLHLVIPGDEYAIVETTGKRCTKKRNVPRFTRSELEILARQAGYLSKNIRTMSYDDLCTVLGLNIAIETPSQTTKNCVQRSEKGLKDHQKRVVDYLEKHRGLIAYHKVGCGKTLTAITVSQCYLDRYPQHRVVFIGPAGLIENFKKEMSESYKDIHHADRYEYYSYQKFTSLVKKKDPPNCKNALVIVDEAHNLRTPFQENKKNPKKTKGINTNNILNCTERANKVLLLTGTPLYNSKNDIYTLYNMIRNPTTDAEILPKDYKNDALFRRLMCKVSYHDACNDPNFPARKEKIEVIDMSPSYKKKYEEVVKAVVEKFKTDLTTSVFGDKDLVPFFNAIRRAVNNLDNSEQNRKIHWLVNKLKTIPSHEKTVVFSNFLDAGIHLLTSKIPKNIRYAVIEGHVPIKGRKEIVNDFNQDKYSVLFISKAGGEGLDMKGVRHVFIMEPSWNEASNEQVIGRAIRYKSHVHLPVSQRNVTIHYMLHVFPADHQAIKEMETYLDKLKSNPDIEEDAPVSPYENSFDVFLTFFLKKKQITIDKYNRLLESFSIERNTC